MSHQGQQLSVPEDRAGHIEQVLLGLADGSYVLSTPEGAVAECGAGVVALLGVPADKLAGRPAADALVAGADPGTRAAFVQLLRTGGAGAGDRIFQTTTADGAQRSLQFVVVAVPLALGWEFTSLLGELGSRDAGTWQVEALRLRHGRALEAIEGVCMHGAQPDPGVRLAGVLVVVRDVDAPELTREDVGRRMAEQREAARAAAADAARRADAATGRSMLGFGSQEPEGAGLEDLVERARILRERVEDAERDAAAAIAEREQLSARLAALEAERAAEAERRDAGDAGARAEAERLHAELTTAHADLQHARSESSLLRGELSATRGELESAQAALDAARRELDLARGEELAGAVAEREALRDELASARHELETARAQLDGTRDELEDTRTQLESTLAAAEGARAEREQARIRAAQLLAEAESARAAAEAIRAEFAFDDPRTPAQVASPADAGREAPAAAARSGTALELPACAPGEAVALIGLDGTFKRLDDAFCSLLGYREEDLRVAGWPSVIDRENFVPHREIARALRAGEIHSAPVETVYMHAQGLLVPVAGEVSMHRPAGGGEATHYLFRADVRRTSGA
ncbi:MAG: hypothetical protein QOE11_21 [Solirubrobacteraceae bacterium]|jgi:PAS domain S-box-containing protein|nr:hypothetical protein [Solirubrobacteraceae bacterium]